MPSDETSDWCLKAIGLNACPDRATDGSDALKPLVFTHAQLVRQTDWCLKTIGFNTCPARETDGSDALKPLVSIHAQLVWRTDLMPLNHLFFITAPLEHVEFRLPKNQWLIHRRICSLPDRWHLLHICIKKWDRLPMRQSVWTSTIGSLADGIQPVSFVFMHAQFGRCLKTIGFNACPAVRLIWCLKTICFHLCPDRAMA